MLSKTKSLLLILFFILSILLFTGCPNMPDEFILYAPPKLSSPTDGATNIPIPPVLIWQASSGADTYGLQVSSDNSFSSFIYNQSGLTITSKQLTGLTNATTYYWRLNSTNFLGTSNWSSVRSFTTSSLPTVGLVAYYPFNGNANDESGNGNNGTVYSASLTLDRFGNSNKAYSFDGNGDYISVADNDLFTFGSSSFSIALWTKISLTTGTYYIMGHDEGGGNRNKWILWYSNTILFLHVNSPSTIGYTVIAYNNWVVDENKWYFITLIRNNDTFSIYINGQNEVSASDSRAIPDPNAPLRIGNAEGNTRYFKGNLDDIRIYNRALTAAEIGVLYHEGGW